MLLSCLLPLTLALIPTLVHAGLKREDESCNRDNNRLQFGTYQFYTDCDSVTYCTSAGVCKRRGCKRADFPFGYNATDKDVPGKCERGFFCPDEEDRCQELIPVGQACQLNRDDECQAPPNFEVLADHSHRGLNFNGSVCLQNTCMFANVTEGDTCIVENTGYTAYGPAGEYVDIVSRGNCRIGLYCDSQNLKCIKEKAVGEVCDADKECLTTNCLGEGICGSAIDDSTHIKTWVYAIVAIGIIGALLSILIVLFLLHRRQRDEDREKRAQYWREQNAFHQNLMQMREAARTSILSLPRGSGSRSDRGRSTYSNDDSQTPILQHAAGKPSGLRNYLSDADENSSVEYDDGLVMDVDRKTGGRF